MAAASTSLCAGATVLLFAARGFDLSVERQLPVAFLALEISGVALLVSTSWVVAGDRPRVAVALAVLGLGILLPMWSSWPALSGGATASVLAAAPLAVPGTALVALGWSGVSRPGHRLRVVYLLAIAGALVHLGTYNPFADPDCLRSCADLRPVAAGVLSPYSGLAITALFTAAAAATAAFAIWTAARSSAPNIVIAGVLGALALLTTSWVLRWAEWGVGQQSRLVVLPFVAAAVVSVTILSAVVRTWRTRSSIERVVLRLADRGAALKDLGGTVRDVHFAVPSEDVWVDSMGRRVRDLGEGEGLIVVSDEGGPIARIQLAAGKEPADVIEALTPATRLALRNAQLTAATLTRVAEVQASQRRIVAASDAERRRIERDLHDGAQQRLVSAALQMRLIRRTLPNDAEMLARAERLLGDALGHLRRLAHGVFPTILTSEGLWVALDELLRASPMPATLEVTGRDDNINAETAMAAYATVGEALEQAAGQPGAGPARVSCLRDAGRLQVSIEINLSADWQGLPDFIDVGDRTGALGGELSVSSAGGLIVVEAVLPCEW